MSPRLSTESTVQAQDPRLSFSNANLSMGGLLDMRLAIFSRNVELSPFLAEKAKEPGKLLLPALPLLPGPSAKVTKIRMNSEKQASVSSSF